MAERAGQSWSPFGDPVGLTVFLGALVAVGSTWQVGFFITDTYAVANGLVNVAHGRLAVEQVYYGLTLNAQPGLSVGGGDLYARNYGAAFLALPVYYGLDLLAGIVDLHLLLVAAWALVLAVTCRQLGVVTDRREQLQTAGSVLAVLVVVGSVPLLEPIDGAQVGILALQVVSMLAVAVTALVLYRLVERVRGQRVGAAAGAATVLATPLWFWASVPKRHALTAAAVATLLFWFAASRESSGRVRVPVVDRRISRSLALRVGGYVLVGTAAWIHAFEGILLLGAFGVSDLATASDTSRRALLAVAVATAAGFAPVFATNVAVTGSPFEPPRLAPSYSPGNDDFEIGPTGEVRGPGDVTEGTAGQRSGDGSGADGSGGGSDGSADDRTAAGTPDPDSGTGGGGSTPAPGPGGGGVDLGPVVGLADSAVGFGTTALSHGQSVLAETGTAPQRLYRTYVRSGRAGDLVSYGTNAQEPIDLTLLESNPLFGGLIPALAGLVAAASRAIRRSQNRFRNWTRVARSPRRWHQWVLATDPARRTDAFALLVVAGFAVMYFPRLPLHSQLTVRYLVPTVPALLYLLARAPTVAEAIERRPRWLVRGYAASVAAGLLGVALVLPRLNLAIGEAMQLHGLVNLAAAVVVAASLAATWFGVDDARVRAITLAVAGGATTTLVVAMQLAYFEYGTYAVPALRLVADAVSVL